MEPKKAIKARKSESRSDMDLIAKKDWHILSGVWDRNSGKQEHDYRIVKGEKVDVPEQFLNALKLEGVI